MSGQHQTYQELAKHWGVTVPAAKQRVRRANWKRMKGNDGVVRILVPDDTERMVTTVPPDKTPEKQALETLRDTVSNLTSVTVKQAERIEVLTTALLASQETNTTLREKIAALEAVKTTQQENTAQPKEKGIIGRVLRVLYDTATK